MSDLLVPCEDGPAGSVGWLRVPDPPPLELDTDHGCFVLDDSDGEFRYIFVRP